MGALRRVVLLAAAAVGIPSCRDDDDPFSSAEIYFVDTFVESELGETELSARWEVAGAVGRDSSRGLPEPALAVGGGMATTRGRFFARDLRVSVDVGGVPAGQGVGGVAIVAESGETLASAELSSAGAVFRAGSVVRSLDLPEAPGFRTVIFELDGQGTGLWSVEGEVVLIAEGLPTEWIFVRVFHRSGGGVVLFDNVLVSAM